MIASYEEAEFWTYTILLLVGLVFVLLQLRTMFFPQKRGRVVEFEDIAGIACASASCGKSRTVVFDKEDESGGAKGVSKKRWKKLRGKMSIGVKVETPDGEIIEGEISPCSICLEKVRKGSIVGVTKMGSRNVVSPCYNRKGMFSNDDFINGGAS